jgi:hypothetical protein
LGTCNIYQTNLPVTEPSKVSYAFNLMLSPAVSHGFCGLRFPVVSWLNDFPKGTLLVCRMESEWTEWSSEVEVSELSHMLIDFVHSFVRAINMQVV